MRPEEIVRHELIGLRVRVEECSNPSSVGISGKVVDESRNTLTMRSESGSKVLVKEECTFIFSTESGELRVDGSLLVGRPEDRIKKKQPKW